jgi:glycosyltransferase involved in cell wall biosynthesis
MKGFQRLIPMMRYLPEADLRIAGKGPYERELHELAADLPNVHFEGLLGRASLARLFHGARAVVVPSLFAETFGYVVLESFAVGTPVVVNEAAGALTETGVLSGGGLGYCGDGELLLALRRMIHDDNLRAELAARGFSYRIGEWSETEHVHHYLKLIGRCREIRGIRPVYSPHQAGTSGAEPRHPLAATRRPQD